MEKKIPVVLGSSEDSAGTTLFCDKGVFDVPTRYIGYLDFLQKPIILLNSVNGSHPSSSYYCNKSYPV